MEVVGIAGILVFLRGIEGEVGRDGVSVELERILVLFICVCFFCRCYCLCGFVTCEEGFSGVGFSGVWIEVYLGIT